MRPNNLTRCIFKISVPNECHIHNNPTIYERIHEIKEKHFKATNQQCIKKATTRMRKHTADIQLKRGGICQKVLLETDN